MYGQLYLIGHWPTLFPGGIIDWVFGVEFGCEGGEVGSVCHCRSEGIANEESDCTSLIDFAGEGEGERAVGLP